MRPLAPRWRSRNTLIRSSRLFGIALLMLGASCAGASDAPAPRRAAFRPASLQTAEAPKLTRGPPPPIAVATTVPDDPPTLVEPIEPLRMKPPAQLEIDLSAEAAAPALFSKDDGNRALECPDSRAVDQPPHPSLRRCVYEPTSAMDLASVTTWVGATSDESEFDGMYTIRQDVIIAVPHTRGVKVIHTLTQWNQTVHDCGTGLIQRRRLARDLGGPDGAELCVESIHEEGEGLATVSSLYGTGKTWVPQARRRSIEAFRLDPARMALVREPELDVRCPRQGYQPFAAVPPGRDAVAGRRLVQGESATPRCPKALMDSCLDMDGCPRPDL